MCRGLLPSPSFATWERLFSPRRKLVVLGTSNSMASTANSVSAANRASGNNLNNPSQNVSGARQPLRTNASLKGADANRRQSASPVDAGQRYVIYIHYLYPACQIAHAAMSPVTFWQEIRFDVGHSSYPERKCFR